MAETSETFEGNVVDIACLRRYPRAEWGARAKSHSLECATMGHCVESGFALVQEDGSALLLEAAATPQVFDTIRQSRRTAGVTLRVRREMKDGEMKTVSIQLVE